MKRWLMTAVLLTVFGTLGQAWAQSADENAMAAENEVETSAEPAPEASTVTDEAASEAVVEDAMDEALAEDTASGNSADPSVCAACHGADGNSSVPQWPKIAGQHPQYLLRQQQLIAAGDRPVPEMMPIVAGMSDDDFQALADYYAEQTLQPGVADDSMVAVGEQLYRAGNPKTGVPACMACHGPAGAGDPLVAYPKLAGQHALYTANMLRKYRDGAQWGEEDGESKIMVGVADSMSDEEIEAVASYLEGLHPRRSTEDMAGTRP